MAPKGSRANRVNGMERAVFVYTTFPTLVEAERVGQGLVAARLAACVNILPGMVSHYRWEGAVERGEEVVMLVKTRAARADAVADAIRAGHSYTTPMIAVLPLESVAPTTLAWLLAATAEEEAPPSP
jgi:periplasmic divalent cation tolerance protein